MRGAIVIRKNEVLNRFESKQKLHQRFLHTLLVLYSHCGPLGVLVYLLGVVQSVTATQISCFTRKLVSGFKIFRPYEQATSRTGMIFYPAGFAPIEKLAAVPYGE